jgi:hypothetical protein
MFRKTLLGLAAAAALAAIAAPSAASASPLHHGHGGFGISIGFPGYGYGYGPYYPAHYGKGYYGPDCYLKKVKVWSHKWDKFVWKTKKVCY